MCAADIMHKHAKNEGNTLIVRDFLVSFVFFHEFCTDNMLRRLDAQAQEGDAKAKQCGISIN